MALHIAYRTLWKPGVLRPTAKVVGGLREWITGDDWAPSEKLSSKKAVLDVYDKSSLTEALTNDFISLATVAMESASAVPVQQSEPRACAWQVISYYYAAYFAANAIMRLSGYMCTNLDANSCVEINQRAMLFSQGGIDDKTKVSPAVFFGSFDIEDVAKLRLQSLSGVKGGVHIQFWNGFLRFIEIIDTEIRSCPLPSPDKKAARHELRLLKSALTQSGKQNGSWLSEVRNSVNYRFEKGVWYPYSYSNVDGDKLRFQLKNSIDGMAPVLDGAIAGPDCTRLVLVSGFLLRWIKDSLVALDVSARHEKRRRIRDGALERYRAI